VFLGRVPQLPFSVAWRAGRKKAGLQPAGRRPGGLQNKRGELSLECRTIEDYDRNFLKALFLASLARTWTSRDAATMAFARWLGFARTGPIITDTTRSLIRGLLREGRIESDGVKIRKVH